MDKFLSSDSDDSSEISSDNNNMDAAYTESLKKKFANKNEESSGVAKEKTKEKESEKKNMNYKSANIFSRITFSWAKIALKLSRENNLKTSDLSTLDETQTTNYHYNRLLKYWEKYKNMHFKYPLILALFMSNLFNLVLSVIIEMTMIGDEYINMYFTNKIIYQFSNFDPEKDDKNVFFRTCLKYIIGLCLSKIYRTFGHNHGFFLHNIISERITNQASALLFTKILRCNTNANVNSKEEGEKINLIEEDCEKIGFIFGIGKKIFLSPFHIGIAIFWLFRILGVSVLYSLLSLIIVLILILIIQVMIVRNFKKLLKAKDEQMKEVVNDLQNIKQIKVNGLENLFLDKIFYKRDQELKFFGRNLYLGVVRNLLSSNSPLIMRIIAISVYIYKNKNIEVSDLFTIINLIGSISMPLLDIPMMLTGCFQNLFSITRIQDFLNVPEHDYSTHENKEELLKHRTQIRYDHVTFGININKKSEHQKKSSKKTKSLDKKKKKEDTPNKGTELTELKEKMITNSDNNSQVNDNEEPKEFYEKVKDLGALLNQEIILLKDLTFEIKQGEFIGILGPTGSGKTCLINSILNNYEIVSKNSDIIINGKISFESQQPFIINATIKNNILFDSELKQERYNKVISCCQLNNDFKLFDKKDELMVSQNGVNLSGGQKARVSLARCLYQDADVYLLDDPLSSIDSKISRKIMQHAFQDFLNGKTRILATNEVSDIMVFDKIIIMDKGKIKYIGNPLEYKDNLDADYKSEKFYHKLSSASIEDVKINPDKKILEEDENLQEELVNENKSKEPKKEKLQFFEKKMSKYSTSSVPMIMYHKYIVLQGGYLWFLLLIVFIICSQISRMKHQRFLADWSKTSKQIRNEKRSSDELKADFWKSFKFFIIYNMCDVFFKCTTDLFRTCTMLNFIRKMFKQMLFRLIKAPINLFHDLCPIGHIISRLTRDLQRIQRIMFLVNMFLTHAIVCGTSCYICYQYNPYSLLITPVIVVVAFMLTFHYLPAARGLQRLHRSTFSPIISLFSEGIKGVETIRTLKCEDKVTKRIFKKLDNHFGIHLYIEGAERGYSILLHALVHFFYCVEVSYLVIHIEDTTAKGIGLLLQQLNMICMHLSQIMPTYKDLEVVLISLERCEAYSKIPREKEEGKLKIKGENKDIEQTQEKLENKEKEIVWPKTGKISFVNYTVNYRKNLPIVLNNINLEIKEGEKIGIVGRTGSGKSTMVLGLSRIIEPLSGSILIDDVDITQISINTLRKKLTIVAQEPFINEGTLKENIDPLNECGINEILNALNDFCILTGIENQKERLGFKIKQNGSNISIGERQLICFARAALTKNKIVILDEATASLDKETEKIIRGNMKKYFEGKTMIIIAHHISMVAECDRIALIDDHKIAECDTYQNLLDNKSSKFYELYKENHTLLK